MTVGSILNSKPSAKMITVRPDQSVADAAKLLSENRIGALIVSRTGTDLAGVLSERDIVREIGKRGHGCLTEPVDNLMTSSVTTISPAESVASAMSKMSVGRFRHLPVVENERMIGVISIGDVVKHRIEDIERENLALTDMIVGHG